MLVDWFTPSHIYCKDVWVESFSDVLSRGVESTAAPPSPQSLFTHMFPRDGSLDGGCGAAVTFDPWPLAPLSRRVPSSPLTAGRLPFIYPVHMAVMYETKSFVFFLFCFFSNLNKSDSYPGSCVMSWKFPSSPAATCAAFLCILFLNNKPVTHSTIKSVNGFESSEACYFSKNRWESCMKTSISNSDAKV